MSRLCTVLLFFTPCLLVGCGQQSGGSTGNVAVVDLDKVANQLGLGKQWAAELTAKQSSVNQQLTGFQQQLNQQLQQKRSQVTAGAEEPLPESQQVQLVSYQEELNEKLRLAQAEAKKHLQGERSRIIQTYRRQAEQISSQVAREKGFDVVLTKNDSVVLTFAPTADITQEVAEQLKLALASTSGASRPATPANSTAQP
ncbi:MAG: OmpH family outer membrane protein [Planctomycetales bacterium]|nr:OmpH family outer membrane protein [Planctomycetales bacterium]